MSNSPQESSLVGTTLHNRYKIIRELGKGGFGQTFLAEDTQMPIHELCVVKQLIPPSFEPQIVEKCRDLFEQEALTLQKLGKSDYIPELKTYNKHYFYLVQEYIEGNTLTEVMLNATEDDVIKIIEDVGNALVEVHKSNIIHRDIKPDNLILRSSNNKIVLIDFGAVKEITTQMVNEQGEVIKTVIIGTNGYMAPEQAQGHPCCASDIYSLGIVAIEKLTRKRSVTFNFDEERNVSWIADLPSGVSVSDQLAKILNKMTRFSLSQRYNNIEEVLGDLQRIKKHNQSHKNQTLTATVNYYHNVANSNSTKNLSSNSQSQETQINNSSFPIKKGLIALPIILLLGAIVFIYNELNQNPSPSPGNSGLLVEKWKTYKDNNHNFEFIYPQNWQFSQDPFTHEVNIVHNHNNQLYNLDVAVDLLQEDKSLDEYLAFLVKDINNQESVSTFISTSQQQIDNKEGRKIAYSIKDNDLEKQVEYNFTKLNQKVYIIKITTTNVNSLEEESVTQKILDSFVIND